MGLSGTICVEKRASIKKWKQDQIKRNEEWERERERVCERMYTFAFASVEEEQSASASASQHF